MSFNVVATEPFERKLKKLAKKHKSFIKDIIPVIDSLMVNPTDGVPIGKDCYKIRVVITSKNKGKSGGARIIPIIHIK